MAGDPPTTSQAYLDAGKALLKSGATLVAYDTFAEGLRHFPANARLRQQLALTLARTGASRRANRILEALVREGHRDEETLGLLARTHKDLSAGSGNSNDRQRHLRLAFEHYRDAYALTSGYWSGINAATMALLLNDRENAETLARRVQEQCRALQTNGGAGQDAYWVLATLAESALILRNWAEAEDSYAKAAALATRRYGDLASTRRNARLIVQHLEADLTRIDTWLRIPPVVVFAGHLIDRPDRTLRRFPPAAESPVREAIRDRLRGIGPGFGYASAACGGDILFLECMSELGAETTIVLPYNRDEFGQESVDVPPGSNWTQRFERVLANANHVVIASEQRMPRGGMSYEYGFLMLDGTAGVRADELDTDLVCMALWDGQPGDGSGGTASSVERWRGMNRRLEIIDLAAIVNGLPPTVTDPGSTTPSVWSPGTGAPLASGFEPRIVGLLFADVQAYTNLTEADIPRFVEHFLGAVAQQLARASHAPLLVNTWGDALHFVFDGVGPTGDFALALCETMAAIDWPSKGFGHEIALRIGLHAGPVYACLDPVTERPTYIGAHVTHAARIEPIAPPGEVYASGAFAALARAEGVRGFHCSYVGQTPLAKGHGTFPTYVVHRRRG